MHTMEEYWAAFEAHGFIKEQKAYGIRYSMPAHLGEGYFELWGDISSCFAIFSDLTFDKTFLLVESVREKSLELGQLYTGEMSYYKKKSDLHPVETGLNYWVNYPNYLSGYKRLEAGIRLVNCGLCYRQGFFESLPYQLPEDFWEASTAVLNPEVINLPAVTTICDQLRCCQLSGIPRAFYIQSKGLEAFALTLDYVYQHRQQPRVHLSAPDRAGIILVKDMLRQNLIYPPSLQTLAAAAGMNRKKLMAGFKQLHGTTVYGYLKRVRMERALELLPDDSLSIAEIARAVGYHGDGHFQQVFKEIYGAAPGRIRKELQREKCS